MPEAVVNSCISRKGGKKCPHRTNLERLTLIKDHHLNLSMKTLPKIHMKLLEFMNLAATVTRRSSFVILAEGKS